MPESLSDLLQQHVDRLSHAPATGFAGVRAKARRRTQRRTALGSITAIVVVAAGLTLAGPLSGGNDTPAAPKPALGAAQLTGTRWLLDSVTDMGTTTRAAQNEGFLVLGWNGNWLLHTGCGNLSGGLSFGDTVGMVMNHAPTECPQEPLGNSVKFAFAGGALAHVDAGGLTVSNDHATLRFTAGAQPDISALTGRTWRLTSYSVAGGVNVALDTGAKAPEWKFGADSLEVGNFCDTNSDFALASADAIEFGGRTTDDQCGPGFTSPINTAVQQLIDSGHAAWYITGKVLTISNPTVSFVLADAGANLGGTTPKPAAPDPARAGTNEPAQSAKLAGSWRLSRVDHGADTGTPPYGTPAALTIATDGRFSGQDGCSTISGTFVVHATTLSTVGGVRRPSACDSAGSVLAPLIDGALLWSPQSWQFDDTDLTVTGAGVTLYYVRAG